MAEARQHTTHATQNYLEQQRGMPESVSAGGKGGVKGEACTGEAMMLMEALALPGISCFHLRIPFSVHRFLGLHGDIGPVWTPQGMKA